MDFIFKTTGKVNNMDEFLHDFNRYAKEGIDGLSLLEKHIPIPYDGQKILKIILSDDESIDRKEHWFFFAYRVNNDFQVTLEFI